MPVLPVVLVVAAAIGVVVVFMKVQRAAEERQKIQRPGLPTVSAGPPPRRRPKPVEYVLAVAILAAGWLFVIRPNLAALTGGGQHPAGRSPSQPAADGQPLSPAPAPGAAGEDSPEAPHPAETPPSPAAEAQTWCAQGDGMMAAGQYSMAVQAYWEALRADPRSERARAGLVRARRAAQAAQQEVPSYTSRPPSSGGSDRAAEPDLRATPRLPGTAWNLAEDARFHRESGDRLMTNGMVNLAIREYEKALQSDPSDDLARRKLTRARELAAQAGANKGSGGAQANSSYR